MACGACKGDPECAKYCAPKALLVGRKQKLSDEIRADYSHKQIEKVMESLSEKTT